MWAGLEVKDCGKEGCEEWCSSIYISHKTVVSSNFTILLCLFFPFLFVPNTQKTQMSDLGWKYSVQTLTFCYITHLTDGDKVSETTWTLELKMFWHLAALISRLEQNWNQKQMKLEFLVMSVQSFGASWFFYDQEELSKWDQVHTVSHWPYTLWILCLVGRWDVQREGGERWSTR